MVNFFVNVRARGCKCNAAVSLQRIENHRRTDVYTVHNRISFDDEIVTIAMSGIIIENIEQVSALLFKLESSDSLIIKDSMLSIIEI